ncbi:uncharacterized protein K460DRAFT_364920 [Cucurbitaria berberidis CBS 394.84]|uniref:Uncharacterized protein n=1 Tax=Cucurbitaria berberidis CBS 394.84 TaxID=1168544 RepID=A0A9P4LBU8_9PLEO|nr:uncharacterized protein K460DRAFT_364920 [Cucurbitaria berberidis CBS 394.84]KAF1848993.1 hypothetical protein K460DRAFT_364920 [Cucurbitaria berberidis CBS 394.84]
MKKCPEAPQRRQLVGAILVRGDVCWVCCGVKVSVRSPSLQEASLFEVEVRE